MIESFTEDQEARLPEFRQKWRAIGLSTEPADRPRAEAAVAKCCTTFGFQPPNSFVWWGSPGALMGAFREQRRIGAPLWPPAAPWQAAGKAVDAKLGPEVNARIWADVVQGSAVDALMDAVWRAVWMGSDGDQPLRYSNQPVAYGAHEADRLGFYAYCREVLGLQQETESMVALMELAQSAGWLVAYCDNWWICERPCVLRLDHEDRVHNLTGPAVVYPDGWSVYVVRGTLVPPEWIEQRKTLDPRIALTWPNVEQRRAAAEIMGWERVLEQLDATTVQADPNPQVGTLLEVELEGRRERFLRVQCGTGRDFVLPVPPELRTAAEANAWTYGLEAAELSGLEART